MHRSWRSLGSFLDTVETLAASAFAERPARRARAHRTGSAAVLRAAGLHDGLGEQLENRLLLDGITPGSQLESYSGVIASAAQVVAIPFTFSAADFILNSGAATLGFHVVARSESAPPTLDPAAVVIRDSLGHALPRRIAANDTHFGSDSVSIADLSPGAYTLQVASQAGTAGAFELRLFFPGDVSGDRAADLSDGLAIFNLIGAAAPGAGGSNEDGSQGAGPDGTGAPYNAAADANLDGRITSADHAIWRRNRDKASFLTHGAPIITEFSPADGESGVSLTRETILRFNERIDLSTIHAGNITILAGGRQIYWRMLGGVAGSDERSATLFYTDGINDNIALPASTEVRVTINADGDPENGIPAIRGRDGRTLDADGDGEDGGTMRIEFRTLALSRIPGTRVFGFVRDAYNTDGEGNHIPVVGARVQLDALPNVFSVTDANGRFELVDVPAPEFFVTIMGGMAQPPPGMQGQGRYATVGKSFRSVPGQTIQLEMPAPDGVGHVNFDIYLPPMADADIRPLNNAPGAAPTEVSFGNVGLAELAAMHPEVDPQVWQRTQVMLEPGVAIDPYGGTATQAVIIPVPPDRLPSPLPPTVNPGLVISVQVLGATGGGGATNFLRPVPISFPNLEGLAPGEKSLIMSFDHDSGEWRVVATGTVSEDGLMIVSDPGQGLVAPGWHTATAGSMIDFITTIGSGFFGANSQVSWDILRNGSELLLGLATLGGAAAAIFGAPVVAPAFLLAASATTLLADITDLLSGPPDADTVSAVVSETLDVLGDKVTASANPAFPDLPGRINYVRWLRDPVLRDRLLNSPQLRRNIGRLLGGGATVLNIIGSVDSAQNLRDSINRLPPRSGDPLDAWLAAFDDAVFNAMSGFRLMVAERLSTRLPSDREVILSTDGPNIRLLELDGSYVRDPLNGQPVAIPISDVISPQFFSDPAFRLQVLSSLLEGATAFSALIAETDPIAAAMRQELLDTYNLYVDLSARTEAVAPGAPLFYVATDPLTGDVITRGHTDNTGRGLFLGPTLRPLRISVFDPATGTAADAHFVLLPPPPMPVAVGFAVGGPGNRGAAGRASLVRSPVGTSIQLHMLAVPDLSTDSDQDGLPDFAEYVVGSAAGSPDTDSDGISDLAEIQQGLDPLDNRGFPTGMISSLPLRGSAREIVVEGSILNAQQVTAYIATGSGLGGLAIVDASQFNNPILRGQIDLDGDARDVAVDSRVGIAAVASGSGGLHLINISDPIAPTLLRTININTAQVEIADGVAYVGLGTGELRSYDVLTGELIQRLILSASAITGMAREGAFLYTMDAARMLRTIDISGLAMNARGFLVLPDGGGRLFVGNGIAYAAAASNFRGGFSTVNVSNPDSLVLISASDVVAPFIVPRSAIVANGSGLGILVGTPDGSSVHALDIMDLSDPSNTNAFLTRITLTSSPQSVALGSGIAFVADGSAGLVVVNYRPFDNQGQAPDVFAALPPGADVDPQTPGTQVVEGSTVPIQALIADDVQVRNVELLVNGVVVRNDVSFPFDLSAVMPAIEAGGGNTAVRVIVRATDTGGNITESSPIDVELVPDIVAPQVISITPEDGAHRGRLYRTVRVSFSESMDESTLTTANIRLIPLNSQGEPGAPLTPTDTQLRAGSRSVQFTFDSLAVGRYWIDIDRTAVTDIAGNSVGSGVVTTSFEVVDATIVWTNPGGGFWDDANNWDTLVIPSQSESVSIRANANATVTIRTVANASSILTLNRIELAGGGRLQGCIVTLLDGAILDVTSSVNFSRAGASYLVGVTLHGDLLMNGTAFVQDFLRVDGRVRFQNASGLAQLVFDGTQTFDSPAGTTLTVQFEVSGGGLRTAGNTNLSLGPGVTVRTAGGSGSIVNGYATAGFGNMELGNGQLTNRGTISAETAASNVTVGGRAQSNTSGLSVINDPAGTMQAIGGGDMTINLVNGSLNSITANGTNTTVTINGTNYLSNLGLSASAGATLTLNGTWTNPVGSTIAASGATLNINGTWSNAGTITATTSTTNLSGSFTRATLGIFNRTGGTVNVKGTLTMQPTEILILNAQTGSWNLSTGGIINGGTVTLLDGAILNVTSSVSLSRAGASYLVGVTLHGDLLMNGTAFVQDFLRVDGRVRFTNGEFSQLVFDGTQTFDSPTGTAVTIQFESSSNGSGGLRTAGNTSLTLGPGVTVRTAGGSGSIVSGYVAPGWGYLEVGSGQLTNRGTISAESNGLGLIVGGTTQSQSSGLSVINELTGTMQAIGGGALTINLANGSLNSITANGTNTTVTINGTNYVGNLGLSASAGATLTLNGTWINPVGSTIAASGGTLNLGGGTNAWSNLGTITAANSAVNLGGAFTLSTLGSFNRTGGTVNVKGTLTMQPTEILTLNAQTGSWNLSTSGIINGGTVTLLDGAILNVTSGVGLSRAGASYLVGVTLHGDLVMSGTAFVLGFLRVDGRVRFTNGEFSQLVFDGTQTFDSPTGTAVTIQFESSSNGSGGLRTAGNTSLTLGPGVTVRTAGGSGSIVSGYVAPGWGYLEVGSGQLTNRGTISAESNGLGLIVGGTTQSQSSGLSVINELTGTMQAIGGGALTMRRLQPSAGAIVASILSSINISGPLSLLPSASITIDIASPSSYGHINVAGGSGAAALDGALTASFVNGYTPDLGAFFQPITFASRTGQFSSISAMPELPVDRQVSVIYNPANVTLLIASAANGAPPLPPTDPTPPVGASPRGLVFANPPSPHVPTPDPNIFWYDAAI